VSTGARKTLKIDPALFDDLDEDRGDRTWNEYLRDLHDQAPIEREYTDIPDARVGEIAEQTAEKVEERLG